MDITESPLMITLRGCNPEDADACEQLIRKTLQSIADNGIPLLLVENALHQVEFHRSEINADQAPFGLSLFMRSALLKQHKVAPVEGLKIHSLFESLHKTILAEPFYLSHLIKKHLIDNTHFVRIVMTPDKKLSAQELAEERAELEKIAARMTQEEKHQLVHQAEELAEFQKKQEDEDIDVLPKVTLDDIPRFPQEFPLHIEKVGALNVYHHACFTNKIVYANLYYELPEIAEEDLAYVRLMTNIMPQLGAGGRTYAENLEYMQAHTGGFGVGLHFNFQATNHDSFKPSLSIRSKALHRKAPKLFPLIQDMITSVDFSDEHRLIEVIQKHYTGLESTLSSSALKYALSLAACGLDVASQISNCWNGIEYYWTVRKLAQNLSTEIKPLMKRLQKLQDQVLGLENPDLVISCEASFYDELKGHGFYGLAKLETKPAAPWKSDYSVTPIEPQGRVIAAPVAYTAKVMNTVSYTNPDAAALSVAVCLFDNLSLHRMLREQGGAYGGGATSNALAGNLYFYSYRDPNIASTLKAFEEAVKEGIKGDFDESDLEEAKLEIIQGLDDPIAPGRRADYAYGWLREGKTPDVRKEFRRRILNVNAEDVINAIKRHIEPQLAKAPTVAFAGRELLDKENAALKAAGLPELTIMNI
jgi:Zn-dependent M16 (insulinase) family peptidase